MFFWSPLMITIPAQRKVRKSISGHVWEFSEPAPVVTHIIPTHLEHWNQREKHTSMTTPKCKGSWETCSSLRLQWKKGEWVMRANNHLQDDLL